MKIKTNETFLNELKSFEAVAENEASKKMIEKIRANFENLEIPNGELLATLKDDANFLNAIEKSMEKMKTASIRDTKIDEKAFANKILTGIENGRFENPFRKCWISKCTHVYSIGKRFCGFGRRTWC